MDNQPTNLGNKSWIERELERQGDVQEEMRTMLQAISVEVAMLKVKSGIWGGIAGLVPALGLLIYFIIKNLK